MIIPKDVSWTTNRPCLWPSGVMQLGNWAVMRTYTGEVTVRHKNKKRQRLDLLVDGSAKLAALYVNRAMGCLDGKTVQTCLFAPHEETQKNTRFGMFVGAHSFECQSVQSTPEWEDRFSADFPFSDYP
eukprot:TRINITY_DN17525_c0_g1_i1.p1 TRINITY_DN17525_c0_g1~~TRINITY_DN17525_c0_g1_i1.p1  ORF type:complete len:128 (-),score=11.32 TRINITY_DN17525_c0_g1_i1:233-616(-)